MSPEVTQVRPYSSAADVFSFSIIVYELFARQTLGSMLREQGVSPDNIQLYAYKVRSASIQKQVHTS
jgi:serine/threonine protein kinase